MNLGGDYTRRGRLYKQINPVRTTCARLLREIFGPCVGKLVLDEQLCLFETELTAAHHTVETDFAIKIYLSAATFWAVEILVLRLKHCRVGPFFGYRVLLITIPDYSIGYLRAEQKLACPS